MNRSHAILAAAVAVLALAGCGADETPAAAPTSATATSAAPKNEVECVNIDRAYSAWDGPSRPTAADDFAGLNEVTMKMAVGDGEDLADAVKGYTDQASKDLSVAVAEYNMELSFANAERLIDKVSAEQATKLEQAAAKVSSSYQAWKTATCT